jgi:hypothetical protein
MKTAEEDYPLIPMNEITDEARKLAVAWMECEDKRWIGNKHKLASDIMNYARRHQSEQDFIAHFKEQGFELYKTEDLKPKLDSLETLKKEKDELVEALENLTGEINSTLDIMWDRQLDRSVVNEHVIGMKESINRAESILSTHKTQ